MVIKTTKSPLLMHFPEIYSGEGELIVPNIALMSISVFDHWLSEEEAGSCRFMNFKVALGQDAEDDYIIGEKTLPGFLFLACCRWRRSKFRCSTRIYAE